jgi:hypothetical protein
VNTNANAATTAITAAYGSPNSWPVVGDWNGDGVDTFAVYNPTTSSWLFSNNPNNAAPSTAASTTYDMSGDLPVSGDWDGDGVDTMGIFRRSSGQWHLYTPRLTQVNQATPSST